MSRGGEAIDTVLDLKTWAAGRMCTSQAAYNAISSPQLGPEAKSHAENRLIVLDTFERQYTVEEDGEVVVRTTMGVIFSSKTLLERIRLLTESGQSIAVQVCARAPAAALYCYRPHMLCIVSY